MERLRQRLVAFLEQVVATATPGDRIGRQATGEYIKSIAHNRRQRMAQSALLALADEQGNVDAFIAQHKPWTSTIRTNAIKIARRLVDAGRAAEALDFLDAAEVDEDFWDRMDWKEARMC